MFSLKSTLSLSRPKFPILFQEISRCYNLVVGRVSLKRSHPLEVISFWAMLRERIVLLSFSPSQRKPNPSFPIQFPLRFKQVRSLLNLRISLKGSIPYGPTLFLLIASREEISKLIIDWLYAKALTKASPPALFKALFESFTLTIDLVEVRILDNRIAPSLPIWFFVRSIWETS